MKTFMKNPFKKVVNAFRSGSRSMEMPEGISEIKALSEIQDFVFFQRQ